MNELKRALVRTIGSHNPSQGGYGANILTPDLCSNIQLTIPQRKTARILGKLAEAPLERKSTISIFMYIYVYVYIMYVFHIHL